MRVNAVVEADPGLALTAEKEGTFGLPPGGMWGEEGGGGEEKVEFLRPRI